jgi:hypothetical protein
MAFKNHLKALIIKNIRIFKRGGICSYCEIIWVILFSFTLNLFRNIIPVITLYKISLNEF